MDRIRHRSLTALGLCLALSAPLFIAIPAFASEPGSQTADFRARSAQDEIIYFLLPDRFENGETANDHGGVGGDRLQSGFDPADPGFYHGGDLAGLTGRLYYIQGLGATALWVAPVFVNKAVQGPEGRESAAYHGYWITDFTRVDPHFGSNEDFRTLVQAAHARGLKVYLDIVINHTADVIQYRECPTGGCDYRWARNYPVQRRGGLDGEPINSGFVGDDSDADFARLTRPDYAYTPYVPDAETNVKVPAWLNDVSLYHNRGNNQWYGQSALDGDFAGLDDIMTENPRVVQGFIDIYGAWIDDYGIDGFRIDTVKHVNPAFWHVFVPAMLERARQNGIPNFHIFGEVYSQDVAANASQTHDNQMPSVLDFPWQRTVQGLVDGSAAPDAMANLIAADTLYLGGAGAALSLTTFNGNHDMGRIGHLILKSRPDISDAELLARTTLAQALVLLGRGVPVLYYGDEQGFTGDGDDRHSRQDMFATRTASYADDRRIGQASRPFDTDATLYRKMAEMARVRSADTRLRSAPVVVRRADNMPGILAMSRLDGTGETLVIFNTSDRPIHANIPVGIASVDWQSSIGACPGSAAAPGVVSMNLPAFGYAVCASKR